MVNVQGLFALMNRSLRTDDRAMRTHISRFLFVLLSYAMVVSVQGNIWLGAPGLRMFRAMCYLNFFCITVAGLSFFSAAITEEKEDMTLGLLKMAGVSSLSLLIGKSTPRLITALVLLTAQLPFTMLAVTLGGVSISQVFAAYTCLFAYLILVANLSLFFSVISPRSRTASFWTGLTLAIYFFSPFFFMIAKMAMQSNGTWRVAPWIDNALSNAFTEIGSTSAFTRIGVILGTGFTESALSHQVVTNSLFGLVFLMFGWALFEVCTRNEKPASEARGLLFKRIGGGGALGAGRAWSTALTWKDFHFVGGGKIMLLLKVLLYVSILATMVYSTRQWNTRMSRKDFGQMCMSIGIFALVIEAAVQASRVFYTETKWKTLSSIVLLPKSIGQIAYPKVAGAAIALIPATALLMLGIISAPESFGDFIEDVATEPGFWYFVSQVVLGIHLAAVFSLYLKWGALPIAVASVWGCNMLLIFFLATIVRSGPPEGIFGLLAICTFIACGAMHFWIGRRLEEVAAA